MRWSIITYWAFLALVVCTVYGKPGGHVTEERREYYQKTSKVIDSPIIYATGDGGTHSSYTASGDILSSNWAQSHMDEIRRMADKLRSEYNYRAMSAGVGRKGGRMRHRYSSASVVDFPTFAGKSQEELDAFTRHMTEQMINGMKSGKILYSQIAQPNYFETQAAHQLEAMSQTQDLSSQQQPASEIQQQNQDIYGAEDFRQYPQTIGGGGYHRTTEKKHFEYSKTHGGYQPVPTYATELEDLNRREEQSSVVYPSTVTIIGGNRFVTKKNCTTAGTTVAASPYLTNFRTSTYDKDVQNILEHGRDIPIVVEQGQSSYNKEQSSYNKQQEGQSVPVYQGSYFTGSNYDSQYNQNVNQNIPIQSQVQGQSSETREGSQYNRQYQTIPVGGSSQTIRTSSTSVLERENQRTPVVIPTSQTATSTSDSYSQTESQRRVPIVYPASSIHRESSSYESVRQQQPVPKPTQSSSQHSIYRHMERESEVIPDYKPVITIDSQTIDSVNEELKRYYAQRPSTIARTEETEHVERNKEVQQVTVVPDVTITIHEQEHKEAESDRNAQSVRLTIGATQQTNTNDRQESSSVLYRPSYPAYGSQTSRNDTEYHEKYQSHYPQPVVTGSTYEKHEEDQHFSREHKQQIPIYGQSSQNTEEIRTEQKHYPIPIYGQTSQNTEEIRTSKVYRNREQPTPVVVGGSSSHQESHEERYTGQRQQQVPQTSTYQETHDEQYTDQRQQSIPQTTNYQESHEEQYTSEQERQKQTIQTYPQTSEKITESNQTSTYHRPGPIYISGATSQQTESDDQVRESTRYREYPSGHRTSQTTSETEDAYWSRYHARPQGVQTSQTQTETEYREMSGSRYPQTGVVTSQSTQEHEIESEDLRRKPGQAGYSVTTHVNETSSSSSSGTVEASQHPVIVASSQENIIEGSSQSEVQTVTQSTVDLSDRERNDSYVEIRDGKLYYPSGYERNREKEAQEYENNRQQGAYGGGMRLEHSEYGSHVNRSIMTGGAAIGYVTHQLTIEQQEELWRRQQEERRRQQLISTGIFEASSLNRSSSYDDNGNIQVNVAQQGVYDGDEERRANGTAHLDKDHYGTSIDISSTSASGKPPGKVISNDRGDQPPQHYEEDYDMNEAEPGIGYYLTEPQAENQVVVPTTPRYSPVYTAPLAPLAPLVVEKDKLDSNKETTVEVWPTTAGETEVQRSFHRKKTTITQTIPVLIGPNGEIIQESGSASVIAGSAGATQNGYSHSASGAYQSQVSGSADITSQNLIEQQDENEQSYEQHQGQEQSYQSQSSSHQAAGGHGDYGSAAYGSEVRYQSRPSSSYSGGGASRYTTGSTSSSVSYQGGGSYSQAQAYGHQQQEDDSLESQLGQQLTIGALEIGDDQQTQDLTQQFVADGQDMEDLNQGYGDYQQSHGAYSQSTGRADQGQSVDGQSSSSYYKSHSAYSSHASSSGGASTSGSSSTTSDQIPAEVQDEESKLSDQNKPGFWRRIGQKAKDLFG